VLKAKFEKWSPVRWSLFLLHIILKIFYRQHLKISNAFPGTVYQLVKFNIFFLYRLYSEPAQFTSILVAISDLKVKSKKHNKGVKQPAAIRSIVNPSSKRYNIMFN